MKDFTATIAEKSERKQRWEEIFGDVTVPIQSPHPQKVNLPGRGFSEVYLLELNLMTEEQKDNLARYLAIKFCVAEETVRRDIESDHPTHGVPILTEDIVVTMKTPPWRA